MTPALTLNLPTTLKARCKGWPLFATTFDQMLKRIDACDEGEVLAGRFSPPRHSAYLVDLRTRTLYRCCRDEPMRVALRRHLAKQQSVRLLATEEQGA